MPDQAYHLRITGPPMSQMNAKLGIHTGKIAHARNLAVVIEMFMPRDTQTCNPVLLNVCWPKHLRQEARLACQSLRWPVCQSPYLECFESELGAVMRPFAL